MSSDMNRCLKAELEGKNVSTMSSLIYVGWLPHLISPSEEPATNLRARILCLNTLAQRKSVVFSLAFFFCLRLNLQTSSVLFICLVLRFVYLAIDCSAVFAAAQTKPANSRAIAAVVFPPGFPRPVIF